ncbi:MAG: hypothetical protein M0P31_03000 [Solirubrobacteraceae bacterium]|nr:hypothetical protein [Solirubrobacteraceae bacterium]
MSSLDPRTPIIVGAGQVTYRRGTDPGGPLDLMVEAARLAAADAGAGGDALLARADSVAVVDVFSWPTPDPGALLGDALGLAPRETVRTVVGGNGPIALLGDLATRIAAGDLDVALLAGGEVVSRFRAAMSGGEPTGWPIQPDGTSPTRVIGHDRPPSHDAELAAGLAVPVNYYPLFEHVLRHAAGRTTAEQQAWIGSWWSRYSDVAAAHPQGWERDAVDATTVATPSPGNRPISDPYLKSMVANITVDQGAALLVTSVGAAEAAGVPRDRWVFVHATAGAADHWFVGERDRLDRSPAIAAAGRALFAHAGTGPGDIGLVDLYSCFPCAVQIGANELGLAVDGRDPLTVTGGLHYFGGPANDYVTHAIATLVERVRERPDERALSSAVGWYMTKHGLALLSGRPPATPYAHLDVQDEVDRGPRREIAVGATGAWTVETYTALHDREGAPGIGTVVARHEDGRRAFARSDDRATLERLLASEPIGGPVELDGDGGFAL